MKILFLKEINEFLNSLIAYVVIGIFLTSIGLLMWVFPDINVFDYGYASMDTLFSLGPYVLMFLIPAITMKSFAEEKRGGTMERLFTLPFGDNDIILAKFFSGLLLVAFSILPTLLYYVSLYYLGSPVGNVDAAGIAGSYVGILLLGAIFVSIGLFASALSGNQIVSFVLAAFLCFTFYSAFDAFASINRWSGVAYQIRQIGILSHYESMSKGLITLSDGVYFTTMTLLFLYATRLVINFQRK